MKMKMKMMNQLNKVLMRKSLKKILLKQALQKIKFIKKKIFNA